MPTWKTWLHGLGAAFVGGAITAGTDAFANGFGFDRAHLIHSLSVGVAAGLIAAALYLKQSPIPPSWDGADRRTPDQKG